MTRAEVREHLTDDETVVFLEGAEFDRAIVGVVERFGQSFIVCYDYEVVLDVLMASGMQREEAVEWFDFNVVGAWMGEMTPCFLHRQV